MRYFLNFSRLSLTSSCDKVWYVSNISWCTYLGDNYIVFENITASIWDLMVANWTNWIISYLDCIFKWYYNNDKYQEKQYLTLVKARYCYASHYQGRLVKLWHDRKWSEQEYILRIHALIFHWLRLPVHVSNQKMFTRAHVIDEM
jgi:hypothetical protein